MADQLLPLDDSTQWTKATSKNGVPFEIGIKKTEHSIERKSEAAMRAEPLIGGSMRVDWPVGDDTWKATTAEVQGRGITRYRLTRSSSTIYGYTLQFTNSQGWAFWFTDDTGDQYKVTTVINGDHCLNYNSTGPTIKWVE